MASNLEETIDLVAGAINQAGEANQTVRGATGQLDEIRGLLEESKTWIQEFKGRMSEDLGDQHELVGLAAEAEQKADEAMNMFLIASAEIDGVIASMSEAVVNAETLVEFLSAMR